VPDERLRSATKPTAFPFGNFQVGIDHHADIDHHVDQLRKIDLRLPAKNLARLGAIS
jgi:hypothetical protein